MRFGAYRGDYLPAWVVEVHFAAGQFAEKAQQLPLFILNVIGAAIAVLVGLVSGKGIAPNEWHHDGDMQKPYPIAVKSSPLPGERKAGSDELQLYRLGPAALGVVLNVKADLCAFVQLRNSGLLYGCNMDKNILAAPIGSDKAIPFGLIEEFYRAVPAHE